MQLIENGTAESGPVFVFAHGAGAPMDSEFMTLVANGLAKQGVRVVRFEFPYMEKRRSTGTRSPPNRAPVLLAHFKEVLEKLDVRSDRLVIGGKSMGGRMATMLASQEDLAGVAVLGYPFHPQGKPERLRIDHFKDVVCPVLICQGARDKLGSYDEVADYGLSDHLIIEWFGDGDHDLKPRKRSGLTQKDHINCAIDKISRFIHSVVSES